MKVLDRYLTRELVFPTLFAVLSLIFLILIADVFNNLDQFLRYKTPPLICLQYYATLVPHAFVQIIHWAAWLAALFLLFQLGVHNELLAMKSAGIKITSVSSPLLFVGFLLGILTFLVSDRVVPATYRKSVEMKEIYIDRNKDSREEKSLSNVTYTSEKRHIYYFRSLAPQSGKAQDMIILWLDETTGKAYQKVTARSGRWNGNAWELEALTEHQIDSRGRILGEPRAHAKKLYADATVSPQELADSSRESVFLTYRQMRSIRDKLKASDVSVQSEDIQMQQRLAAPWQSLVMLLFTIPVLAKTRSRRTVAAGILFCVILAFAYHVSGAIFIALGESGILTPFLAAWMSHIVFAVGALLQFHKGNY